LRDQKFRVGVGWGEGVKERGEGGSWRGRKGEKKIKKSGKDRERGWSFRSG